MCDFEKGFVLCTCQEQEKPVIHNKNSRRHKKTPLSEDNLYQWSLAAFVGTFESMMEGMFEIPSKDIGKGLTAEWVLLNLNDRNCFDFEYIPQEGDALVIRKPQTYVFFLSFVYKNGVWTEDFYSPFGITLKKIGEGVITPKDPLKN